MACDKINHRCGEKKYGVCISYETNLPNFSNISGECASLEETTTDLYQLVGTIRTQLDVTQLDLECITLINPTVKNLLQALITNLCTLNELVETQAETIATMQGQIVDLQNVA